MRQVGAGKVVITIRLRLAWQSVTSSPARRGGLVGYLVSPRQKMHRPHGDDRLMLHRNPVVGRRL